MRWILTDEADPTMHSMMGQIGMEHDHHHQSQSEQEGHYSHDGWVQINNYSSSQQTSPVYEYQNFQFMHHGLPHSLPVEPTFTRMPPPQTTHSHHQLLPLIMPSHPTWPSMLTNPAGYQAPPVAIPPSSAPVKPTKLPAIHAPSPRKTLTDQDRRQMCQYHEDHPSVKQTEIGAMFGVERSTVSKVLRQKEKYLFPEDHGTSPVKRSKGKFPDIDRALSSWVRNSQKQGLPLTDAAIKEKARVWAATVGSSESHSKANSSSWLEKFKQKNNIGGAKLSRRASETNVSDSGTLSQDSTGPSASHTPNGHSPRSPGDRASPLSGAKTDESMKPEGMEDYIHFGSSSSYRHSNSQSTASLSSTFTDTVPSFSGGTTSPSTPFAFSPETTQGPFATPQYSRLPPPPQTASQQRPRSQTFPMLNIDPSYPPDAAAPKFASASAPGPALDSPTHDLPAPFAVASPTPHHRPSNASTMPPLSSAASTSSGPPTASTPSSPTQDDARRALETLLSYVSVAGPQGLIDENEYRTVVILTERMRAHSLSNPGGLPRIAEQDGDAGAGAVVKMDLLGMTAGA